MSIKRNIGKNTLGDGKKMQVDMRTYNRSTHDLSFAWRNTQGVGTLVPCFKQVGLPGDTFDIDIDAKVLTHPTVGPLFGSYKLQVDFFVAPMRLYQAMLHNNALNIGLDMSKVKLPKLSVNMSNTIDKESDDYRVQIHPSCILAYLGRRGYGRLYSGEANHEYKINAVPMYAYLDIFKNYYANKQEEYFYYLAQTLSVETQWDVQTHMTTDFNYPLKYTVQSGSLALMNTSETAAKKGVYVFGNLYIREDMSSYYEKKEYTYDQLAAYATGAVSGTNYVFTFPNKTDGTGFPAKDFIEFKGEAGLQIKKCNLEELDDLREGLLGAGSNETKMGIDGRLNGTSQGKTYTYFKDLFGGTQKKFATKYANQGLLLKTHMSDMFTNWVNTEWVDGDNGISQITAVSTAGDEFTIDSLNLAKKVYDMLNRIAVSGGSYRDWIETVYTSNFTIHAESPIYEGGMSDEIVFQEVVSNSATAEEPLGTLAGKGTLAGNRKGGKLHIKISEPSYIIGICSITPRVDYCQGNDWDTRLETMNDLHKPQLDGIGYQDVMQNDIAWWANENTSYGKTVAWLNYMTNVNKTYGNFAVENNEAFMVLNRYFDNATPGDWGTSLNTSSYINPNDFNYTFAETSLEAQNFWVQLGFGVKARRVISAKQIPNL